MNLEAMRIFAALWSLVAVVCAAGAAYAQEPSSSSGGLGEAVRSRPVQSVPGAVASPAPNVAPTGLTLEQKVAQLFVVTMQGVYRPHPSDRELFQEIPPGGVIIPSVARPSHAAQYIASLRGLKIEATTGIPLFIAANVYALTQHEIIDEHSFMELPSMLSVVAADDDVLTGNLARRVAQQLRTMGFNMHLGPSLALASPIGDSEGTTNNFGSDPDRVGSVGSALLAAMRGENLIAVATGFPGGVSNAAGSPPVLVTAPQQLEERDLAPFAQAIKSGLEIMHVGNTVLPMLDDSLRPASQSPLVIEGLLKYKLGFTGLVMAGPIDGVGTPRNSTSGRNAIASLRAGADLLYMQSAGTAAMKAIFEVSEAVRSGELPESVIDKALDRVVTVKSAHGLMEWPLPDEKAAEQIEKTRDNFEETYRIERQAITLVQNQGNILPLSKEASMPLGITGVVGVEELHEELEKYIKKLSKQRITTARHIRRLQDFEIERLAKYAVGMRTAVVVLTNDLPYQGQARLITALQEKGARVVVVLLGYPAHLPHFRHADAIVCAYTSGTNVSETMRAVADILAGAAPIAVLPAVRELRRAVGQPIPFDVCDVIRSPIGRLPATMGPDFEAGQSLTYDPGAMIKRVEWDFGNGKRAKAPQTTHTYAAPGTYTVRLSVTDRKDVVSSGTFQIIVE